MSGRRRTRRAGAAAVLAGALACAVLGACSRGAAPAAPAKTPGGASASLLTRDLGASLLAAAENARWAIAAGDRIAAADDVEAAIADADQLPDQTSRLFLAEAPMRRARPGQARTTVFEAQTRLLSAQEDLVGGDFPGADADLAAIVASVPAALAPADLPLLRADESLALAQKMAAAGRTSVARTQLGDAEAALKAYAGTSHAAAARAIAASMASALAAPGARVDTRAYQLGQWADTIDGWG